MCVFVHVCAYMCVCVCACVWSVDITISMLRLTSFRCRRTTGCLIANMAKNMMPLTRSWHASLHMSYCTAMLHQHASSWVTSKTFMVPSRPSQWLPPRTISCQVVQVLTSSCTSSDLTNLLPASARPSVRSISMVYLLLLFFFQNRLFEVWSWQYYSCDLCLFSVIWYLLGYFILERIVIFDKKAVIWNWSPINF